MRGWLKGGLIWGGIYFLIAIVSFVIYLINPALENILSWIFGFPIIFIMPGLIWLPVEFSQTQSFIILIILNLPAYFLIGAFIGFLIEKFKSQGFSTDLKITFTLSFFIIIYSTYKGIKMLDPSNEGFKYFWTIILIILGVTFSIILILVGAIMAWIIKKIKSKKQIKNPPQITK